MKATNKPKNIWKLNWYVSTLIVVFLNQKRINKSMWTCCKNGHVAHLYCMFTYIYCLLIEKDFCEWQNMLLKFPCALLVYLCHLSGDLHFFSKSFPYLFIFYCLNIGISVLHTLQSLILLVVVCPGFPI